MKSKFLFLSACIVGFFLFIDSAAYAQQPIKITVATDGSGNYTTVQEAFNAVPDGGKKQVIIYIRNGVYKEKLSLETTKKNVTIIGEDKFNTILTYDDHTGKMADVGTLVNTRTSYSFLIKADNFTAKNISFQNDAGFTAGQAVAVESDGDKATFDNCRFVGFQDVLFLNNDKSRQYFNNCYIEGTTDFIFGSATAWFEKCHIHSKKDSHITAASTPKENGTGFVFNDCILTGDTSLHNVSLGRPWRPYASVSYIRCYIGAHILAAGWNNWKNPENEKTARYVEFENYGPGAGTTGRLEWIKQLNKQEVKQYNLKNIFGEWEPGLK
ncbi:MAG: pectinesterase family protein [Ferruginibacter sp.]